MIIDSTHQDDLKRKKRRWYSKRRTQVGKICVHHTAVGGGFGTRGGETIAHRYFRSNVPYHAVWNPARDTLVYNLPFDLVSWHGNGANRDSIGFAWDDNSLTAELDAGLARVALCAVIAKALTAGYNIRELTAHCAFTRKPHDPGAQFVDEVMQPVAIDLGLQIDWNFATKRGRSLARVSKVRIPRAPSVRAPYRGVCSRPRVAPCNR